MSSIDWDKEGEGSFTVYPAGTHKVKINKWEQVTAKTGTKQIRWSSTIMTDEITGPFTVHTPLTDKALWKIAKLVKACGFKDLGKMEIGSLAFNKVLDGCIGRTAYWTISIGPDQKGNERNEVDDFRPDNEQEVLSLDVASNDDTPDFLK